MYQYTQYRKKSAFRFVINEESGFVGFECANVLVETINNENPNYDWNNKIILSFSLDEIGKFLALLEGHTPSINLFHTSKGGTKTLKGQKMDNGNILLNVDFSPVDSFKKSVNSMSLAVENQLVLKRFFEFSIMPLAYVNIGK